MTAQIKATATLVQSSSSHELNLFLNNFLKTALCKNQTKGCQCSTCGGIEQKIGYNFLWLAPDGFYETKVIDQVLETVHLKPFGNSDYYIILELVEQMSKSCFNRLLKTLEEPPAGYKFILTTINGNKVPPTIKSRCHLVNLEPGLEKSQITKNDELTDFFLSEPSQNAAKAFFDLVEKLNPDQAKTEQSFELLSSLARTKLLEKANRTTKETTYIKKLVATCDQFAKIPAQPGSGKLFWKTFFVQLFS